MTLVEELLQADIKKADELSTSAYSSKRLATILGKDEPVEIKITQLKARRLNDVMSYQFNKKGDFDISKSFDAKLICCSEGIVSPDVKDKALQKHFGCATPKDLVYKLFDFEVNEISDAICELSGITQDTEEEIKNS